MTVSTMSAELLTFLQPDLIGWCIIISWIVLGKDWIVVVKVKVTEKVQIPVNIHRNDISAAAEPSVTELGMVMQHHGRKGQARRLVCCLQVQGHSENSFDQI